MSLYSLHSSKANSETSDKVINDKGFGLYVVIAHQLSSELRYRLMLNPFAPPEVRDDMLRNHIKTSGNTYPIQNVDKDGQETFQK